MLYLKHGIAEKDSLFNLSSSIDSFPAILNNAINQNFRVQLLALQPDLPQFKRITKSLPSFIDLQFSVEHTTPKLIDEKLLAKAFFLAGVSESSEFDSISGNTQLLHKLQKQFGLPVDSVLNEDTHRALVSLIKYRYYQACLNLNRLRIFNNSEEDFLFVNIPEFKLHVIVGKEETPTPVFSGNIEKVIANPYWTVPKSIAINEMLPKIRRDSTYMQRNGYYVINSHEEVVDISELDWSSSDPFGNKYCIRQINSTNNSLGLFKRKNRTFSHGCIRLENPDKLAQYLTDKYISPQKVNINNLIKSRKNREVLLEKKVNIHIQYITCSGSDNAELEFYNDIYKLDKQEISTIFPEQAEI
jgi:murein L,D-transpeptidase YcbB/YkuD